MLTEIYIEVLLVDEELADQIWESWDKGEVDALIAWFAWWNIAASISTIHSAWGRSSAGRASRSQCEGREFDPPRLHQMSALPPIADDGLLN